MFRIKRRIILMVAATTLLSIVVTACGNETATPEQLPTFMPTSTKTMMPAPTTMATSTATPYPADPSAWNLEGKEIQVTENEGYTTYALEEWQINLVLPVVTESFNKLYIYADHNMTPDEMMQYYDTNSPAWLGPDDGQSVGFLGQYEDNASKGAFIKLAYPIEEGNELIYTNWKIWAIAPPKDFDSSLYHYDYERFTAIVRFRMEEAPLYVVEEDTQEIVFEHTYFGPALHTFYLQFVDGQWKIVDVLFEDLGTYVGTPTPTPDQ